MDAERRGIMLDVGEFTRLALQQRDGSGAGLIREAALYYLSDSGSKRPGWIHPGFPDAPDHQVPVELKLAAAQWRGRGKAAHAPGITREGPLEAARRHDP